MSKKNRNKNKNRNNEVNANETADSSVVVENVAKQIADEMVSSEAEVYQEDSSQNEMAEEPAENENEVAKDGDDAAKVENQLSDENQTDDADEINNSSNESESKPDSDKADEAENAVVASALKAVNDEKQLAKEAAALASKNKKERTEEAAKAKEMDAKREARHIRRIRNQIISIAVVIIFFAIIGTCGFFLVSKIISITSAKKVVVQAPEPVQQEEEISDLIGNEPVIEEPVVTEQQVIEEPEPEPVIEDPLGDYIDGIIASMSLEQKVAGIFITSPEALTGVDVATVAGNGTKTKLDEYSVGGIVYDKKNVTSHDQFEKMVSGTREMIGDRPVFIAIAEEGGDNNSPVSKVGFYDKQDSAAALAETNDVGNAYNAGMEIGTALSQMGINLVLGPVTDPTIQGSVLGDRTFGDTAVIASGYVNHMMDGYKDGGVNSCLKYFPGYGGVNTNPANGRAVTDREETEFRSNEFLTYQAAIQDGADMIMMSDVVINCFDDSQPATLSDVIVTNILRNELAFEGVIVSANLSDAAVSEYYSDGEATVLAIKAGCDMILSPKDFAAAYNAVVEAVNSGVIAEDRINDSLKRIYRVLYADSI